MAVIGQFENGRLLVSQRVAGPASYATAAPPAIVFEDLSVVEEVLALTIDDGRGVQELVTTLASVTFRVRGESNPIGAAGAAHEEVPDATDLSASIITGLAYGR